MGRPRPFQSMARVDRVVGDAAYDRLEPQKRVARAVATVVATAVTVDVAVTLVRAVASAVAVARAVLCKPKKCSR